MNAINKSVPYPKKNKSQQTGSNLANALNHSDILFVNICRDDNFTVKKMRFFGLYNAFYMVINFNISINYLKQIMNREGLRIIILKVSRPWFVLITLKKKI